MQQQQPQEQHGQQQQNQSSLPIHHHYNVPINGSTSSTSSSNEYVVVHYPRVNMSSPQNSCSNSNRCNNNSRSSSTSEQEKHQQKQQQPSNPYPTSSLSSSSIPMEYYDNINNKQTNDSTKRKNGSDILNTTQRTIRTSNRSSKEYSSNNKKRTKDSTTVDPISTVDPNTSYRIMKDDYDSGVVQQQQQSDDDGSHDTKGYYKNRNRTIVTAGSKSSFDPNCNHDGTDPDEVCTKAAIEFNNTVKLWLQRSPFILLGMKIIAVAVCMLFVHYHAKHLAAANGGGGGTAQQYCTALQMALSASTSDDERITGNNNTYVVSNMYNGIVASDQPICSQLGLSILQEYGGNAIDATITTALCLGLVNPASSGLGGGTFILIQADPIDESNNNNNNDDNSNNKQEQLYNDARTIDSNSGEPVQYTTNSGKIIEVIDAREVAPAAAYTEMFIDIDDNNNNNNNNNDSRGTSSSVYGGLSIAVPGELRGLELAHQRYGSLPWETLVQPVIDLAKTGVPVSKYLAGVIQDITKKIITGKISYNTTAWRLKQYITKKNSWDTPLQEGDKIRNTNLLRTLQDVQQYGADALYSSNHRANQFATDIQNAGGIVTVDDLESYRPTIRTPVIGTANGFTIVGVPPPSSGGATIIGAIRFLSYFVTPLASFAETLSIHRIVEAMKHVFAIRMSLSDPAYNTDTVSAAVYDLVYGNYMSTLRYYYYQDNTTLSLSNYGGYKWSQITDNNNYGNNNVQDVQEGDRFRERILLHQKQGEQSYNKKTNDEISASETLTESEVISSRKNANRKQVNTDRAQRKVQRTNRKLYRTYGNLEDGGTSHFSVVDKFGNAVSITTSINTVFGSLVVSPSTGIVLGNTMDDFANPDNGQQSSSSSYFGIEPSEANYIEPGKKPLSSMAPTFVYKQTDDSDQDSYNTNNGDAEETSQVVGDLHLIVGASGGPKIITAVLQVIVNYIFMGRSLLQSIVHPRVHDQLVYHGAGVTTYEQAKVSADVVMEVPSYHNPFSFLPGNQGKEEVIVLEVSDKTKEALEKRDHVLVPIDYTGCVQAIAIDSETQTLTGVSDLRKRGAPAGY